MYVSNKMITDVVSIFPEASISLAFQTMHEKNVSQLPVIKDKKLVGLVTETLLGEFTPSKATTLSIYELNYILGKTNVAAVMSSDVAVCYPETLIENVAKQMNDLDVNMIPVVNDVKELLGIISRSDIIDAFLEIIGAKDTGSRITIKASDKTGTLAEIASIVKEFGVNITHISNFNNPLDDSTEIILRLNTLEVDALVESLKTKGYDILRIDKH